MSTELPPYVLPSVQLMKVFRVSLCSVNTALKYVEMFIQRATLPWTGPPSAETAALRAGERAGPLTLFE